MKTSTPTYPSRGITWARINAAERYRTSVNSSSKIFLLTTLFFCLFLLLLVTVWIHINFVHLGYQVAHLKQQERRLEFKNRGLKLQEEYLLNHSKLQTLAIKKFHLSPLTPEQVIVANEKGQF